MRVSIPREAPETSLVAAELHLNTGILFCVAIVSSEVAGIRDPETGCLRGSRRIPEAPVSPGQEY